MNRTTRRLKALLTAVAFGACCAYAQIAPPAGFVLPDADPDAAPYDFHMSKTDDGMSVSLTSTALTAPSPTSITQAIRHLQLLARVQTNAHCILIMCRTACALYRY